MIAPTARTTSLPVWLGALCLALLLAACSDPASPQPCTAVDAVACWTYLGLEGKPILSLASTRSGGVVAGTLGDGIWKLDGSGQWTRTALAGFRVPALLPVLSGSQELLFAGVAFLPLGEPTKAAVEMSLDGGDTWIARDGGLSAQRGGADIYSLATDPGVPGRIFAGTEPAVLRSDDYGASWSVVYGTLGMGGPSIASMSISRTGTSARIWAGGMNGAGDDAFVRYSDDGGATWVKPTRPGFDYDFIVGLLADPAQPDHLLAGMRGGVRETRDGGATWTVALATTRPANVHALARIGARLVAVSDEDESGNGVPLRDALGVYGSHDGGVTWDTLAVPPTASGGFSVVAESENSMLVGTRSGVWRVRFRQQ